MSLTINAKTFTADAIQKDSVGYSGPAHTLTSKDYAKLSRVAPKPTVSLSGVGHTNAKLTRTLTLTGALTPAHDGIVDIKVSIPVGAASADVNAILNDMGALLASASFKTHVKSQQINY
jgi:hypothetical protein